MQPDMTAIREALMRRRSGGGMSGGGATPMAGQVSQPMSRMPGGAPNSPLQTPPPVVNSGAVPMPAPQPQGQSQGAPAGSSAPKPQPSYDDSTKATTKALIAQLMKVL